MSLVAAGEYGNEITVELPVTTQPMKEKPTRVGSEGATGIVPLVVNVPGPTDEPPAVLYETVFTFGVHWALRVAFEVPILKVAPACTVAFETSELRFHPSKVKPALTNDPTPKTVTLELSA
jgi:hypothetical protein